MHAEIIAIGDELTSGQRLDTNSQWISRQLADLGVPTRYHTTVSDDHQAMLEVFRTAVARATLVVVTGGLGPTADDITRQVLAEVAGVPLVVDQQSLETIRHRFARRNRQMPLSNEIQAHFPQGSEPIPNPSGTAPGIAVAIQRTSTPPHKATDRADGAEQESSADEKVQVFALPGVPAELKEMWRQTVVSSIGALPAYQPKIITHRRLKCFGKGESELEQMIPGLIARGRIPTVGITVHKATITLRISASGQTREAALAAMEATVAESYEKLGMLIFGEEEDELQHVAARLLAKRGEKVAIVEWGTQGLLAHWMATTEEAAKVMAGGVLVSNESAVTRMVAPEASTVNKQPVTAGNESPQSDSPIQGPSPGSRAADEHHSPLALKMAAAVREQYGADYGLAIGPFNAPTSDQHQGLGHVETALCGPDWTDQRQLGLGSHPAILHDLVAKNVLNRLRIRLLRRESGEG